MLDPCKHPRHVRHIGIVELPGVAHGHHSCIASRGTKGAMGFIAKTDCSDVTRLDDLLPWTGSKPNLSNWQTYTKPAEQPMWQRRFAVP